MASFICVSQATIVAIFGPSMALTAESPEGMIAAIGHMRDQQAFVFKIAIVSATTLFVSTALLCWAKSIPPVASAACTLAFMVVYYLMIVEGKKAYQLFALSSKKGRVPHCKEMSVASFLLNILSFHR